MTLEAEQACIGGVMIEGEIQDKIFESLRPEHFFDTSMHELFVAASKLHEEGETVDPISVGGKVKIQGAVEMLVTLMDYAPTPSGVDVYTQIVKTSWMRAKMASVSGQIKAISQNAETGDEIVEQSLALINPLVEESAGAGFVHIAEASKKLLAEIVELSQSGKTITGLATGFSMLDHITGGLQDGDLIVVGGRPSHGKTASVMAIAHYVAQKHPVLVFSAEMQVKELVKRSVSMFAQIDFDRIKNAQVTDADTDALVTAQAQHKRRQLYVDDRAGITINQLRSRAKAQARKVGCDLLIVDYLQLVRGAKENRVQEVTEVSAGLKALAKELDCPLIAIAQLSRGLEQRPNKRPVNSDLRDSGTIEQDADVIAFCYMDEKYDEDSPRKGIQEFIIRKQRQGPLGTVYLDFDGAKQTITQRMAGVPALAKKSGRKKLAELG